MTVEQEMLAKIRHEDVFFVTPFYLQSALVLSENCVNDI
jgi:hypothetical protein